MRHKYIYFTGVIGLLFFSSVEAQFTDVINNEVLYEFQVQDNYYNGTGDALGASEPSISNNFWLSSYGWVGWQCYTWDCNEPCYNTGNPTGVAGGANFNDEFQITILAFESDNSDQCVYTSGDDDFYNANATLRDGSIQMRLIYPSSDFRPCQWNPWLASGTGWLFPASSVWDQIWKMTWRYAAGDNSRDPLKFGVLQSGDSKSDINATTRLKGQWSELDLNYTNQTNQPSPDVWYEFTINTPSQVTVSTINGVTNFDTYLWLYTTGGGYISDNDDAVPGIKQSTIQSTLSPGTYLIGVEGYDNWTGVFQLDVQVKAITSSKDILTSDDVTIFPNPSSGVLTVDLNQIKGNGIYQFEVYDVMGRRVYNQSLKPGSSQLDLSHLHEGIYSVVLSGDSDIYSNNIIIQR
jgi:hypothetical protein